MKELMIDSSSLISLSSNCLLWVLDKLKESTNVEMVITPEVRDEVVKSSLGIDKFRLGGIRVLKRLCNGEIRVRKSNPLLTKKLLTVGNSIYSVRNHNYKIIHKAEMSLISLYKSAKKFMLIDERIVEKLINDPFGLKNLLERRLHMKVTIDPINLKRFQDMTKGINVIKSSDLIAVAQEKGLLKDYVKECYSNKVMKDFLSGAFWGLKNTGCAISTLDIREYLKELKETL